MSIDAHWRRCLAAMAGVALVVLPAMNVRADMMDMTGVEPWHACASCHGLDGAGNAVKFPRLAGLQPAYLVKQLQDFLASSRKNDGGQMQATVTEIAEEDFPRVAEWFASQTPPWPGQTLEADADSPRIRQIVMDGVKGIQACVSCHHANPSDVGSLADVAPRIAGQRDFYIAKQLANYRDGSRANGSKAMQRIARELSDADIAGIAVFLSRDPDLHERMP